MLITQGLGGRSMITQGFGGVSVSVSDQLIEIVGSLNKLIGTLQQMKL